MEKQTVQVFGELRRQDANWYGALKVQFILWLYCHKFYAVVVIT